MHASISIVVAPTTTGMVDAISEVRGMLEREGASSRSVFVAQLAIEELVGNVIRHGAAEAQRVGAAGRRDGADRGAGTEGGGVSIVIAVEIEPPSIRIRIEDSGPAFNPLDAPRPHRPIRPEDVPVGGRGIFMVRSMVQDLRYERAGGLNRVTVVIPLGD